MLRAMTGTMRSSRLGSDPGGRGGAPAHDGGCRLLVPSGSLRLRPCCRGGPARLPSLRGPRRPAGPLRRPEPRSRSALEVAVAVGQAGGPPARDDRFLLQARPAGNRLGRGPTTPAHLPPQALPSPGPVRPGQAGHCSGPERGCLAGDPAGRPCRTGSGLAGTGRAG
jgi:hypothetical protein